MTRSQRKSQLVEEIEDWREVLKKAFLAVVNKKRKSQNLDPYPRNIQIKLPSEKSIDVGLRLLTLKVWCIRLQITPEWLLEQLLWLNRKRRDPDDNPNLIHLGIAASNLIGVIARNFIDEALIRDFPNGENRKSSSKSMPHEIRIENLDFSIPEVLSEYTDAILRERERLSKSTQLGKTSKRTYRKI